MADFRGTYQEKMEIGADEDVETGFLHDVSSLDQSTDDSFKGSFSSPMFSTEQSIPLQRSQGFCFGETFQPGTSSQSMASTSSKNMFLGIGTNDMNVDVKPVLISSEFSLPSVCSNTNKQSSQTYQNPCGAAVFDTGALVMSLQNNHGVIDFGQSTNKSGVFKSENVFTFGSNPDPSQVDAQMGKRVVESSDDNTHVESKGMHPKHSSKHRQRKSRSRTTSNDNVQKIEPSPSFSPTKLETSELPCTSEVAFKPSLLDEILTEKKLELMRSPEVIQFLQSQQKKITHGQYTES